MQNSFHIKKLFVFIGDIIVLILALVLAIWIGFGEEFSPEVLLNHLWPFSFVFPLWLTTLYILGFYDSDYFKKTDWIFLFKLALALAVFLVLSTSFFYFAPLTISPKTNLVVNILLFGVLFLLWRNIVSHLFTSRFKKKVAFVGEGPEAEVLKEKLQKNPHLGYQVISLNPETDFLTQIKTSGVNTLIAGKEIENLSELEKNLYFLMSEKIDLMDLSQAFENILEKVPASFIGKSWFLRNTREAGKGIYERVKRLGDFLLSLVLLIATFPFWILIAFIIKIQGGGKIFYKQERVGKGNRVFKVIKFRTMREDAEKQGALWAKENDPRVTRFGKFLRASHLDELPQLINILRGDLSFVGPRPERPEFVRELEEKIPHYRLRHVIKPGLTGWAQIKFRYARSIEDSQEKFEYDLFYLKNRNLLLDLGIILKTLQKFFKN